jgi:hypothetical protein
MAEWRQRQREERWVAAVTGTGGDGEETQNGATQNGEWCNGKNAGLWRAEARRRRMERRMVRREDRKSWQVQDRMGEEAEWRQR